MNDLMSGGLHRWWKYYTHSIINYSRLKAVTDVACGSGDLLIGHAKRMPRDCVLTGIDPNAQMLARAKERMLDLGHVGVELHQAYAEALPLADNSQDILTISFGLRNTTDMPQALAECYRVLRTGGRLVILEFSHPTQPVLRSVYSSYARIIPTMGQWVTQDRESYQYLIDSIATHPDQATLAQLLREAGLALVRWINLSGGIVALHLGYKV